MGGLRLVGIGDDRGVTVSTRRRHRLHLDAEHRTRARILPDVSTRQTSTPSRFPTPIAEAIEAYRQTPEAWREVWEEKS
jgi:hypothetical protein